VLLAVVMVLVSCALVGATQAAGAGPAVAAKGPACLFGSTTPGVGATNAIIVGVTPGAVVDYNCSGFPASRSYLIVEASLLVAIDPAAKPLLTGQATSVPGLLAIIAALPELNALSVAFPNSDASGHLTFAYTVPSSEPPDPNATCPPTTPEFNSGLVGCALAMIDLTTFKPMIAGTAVLHYKGTPFFPPNPTLALSPSTVHTGQPVAISDVPGAQSFWWVATLASLYANLAGGSGSGGAIPVIVKIGGRKAHTTGAGVTPASYNNAIFTPPKLSGTFLAKKHGHPNINVILNANVLVFPLSNAARARLHVLP
jgi:hypothetical protein